MWGGVAIGAAPLSSSFQIISLLVGVAIIGAPHGIFDIDLALWCAPSRHRHRWVVGFFLVYIALMVVVALGWLFIPPFALIGFLAVAAFHFGCEGADAEAGKALDIAPTLTRGVAVILGPMVFHATATASIFAGLAGVSVISATAGMSVASTVLVPVWGASLIITLGLFAWRRAWIQAVELAGLIVLFAICPPLFAFTVYFCGVHAVRHTCSMARTASLRGGSHGTLVANSGSGFKLAWAVRRLLPAVCICSLAAGAVVLHARGSFPDMGGQAVLWIFRSLAALTVPHLLLTPVLEARCGFLPNRLGVLAEGPRSAAEYRASDWWHPPSPNRRAGPYTDRFE
ncbi:MAG: Brp/Blh family beta-carotene 15,15'-dioxygenase [Caulobacteraceae bacterium]